MPAIHPRTASSTAISHLISSGYPPALARIFAARGITQSSELGTSLSDLLPFDTLKNAREMARLLADAIAAQEKILVVADYDADGATACSVAMRGLLAFGATVSFLVPNRFEYGYGLTPEIVALAAQSQPDILLTVDNGIASIDGVAAANRLGMRVFVTDHHLPADTLPDAACIVNPNQPDCQFPSKNLAGVGVMFYVLLALRAELRARGAFATQPEPKLAELLDLVALGTVADVVKLDQNNRVLVQQGLARIRAGRGCAGINALLAVARKQAAKLVSMDLGFAIAPRLNAAGRLDDMSLGIACLLSDDEAQATRIATQLDALNQERRAIESDMQDGALAALDTVQVQDQYSLALFDDSWHQGVIGILASRLKDKFHRPVITFARATSGNELKGSGRSISGLHLRDALDLVSKRHPTLIKKFGGHAAAAGLTIDASSFEQFVAAFEQVVRELLDENDLQARIDSDGSLDEIELPFVEQLEQQIWGQGFPAPLFDDDFVVENQRVVGEKHLKLRLGKNGASFDAILFGDPTFLPEQIHACYTVSVNEYNGRRSVQLMIKSTAALSPHPSPTSGRGE
ncbi:MAG: single-stranded-DNA-specific exonuclease RecJ [Gallionella sp.]|nr:single-stranded-DNA-specific exonuclease RecJ [Gallionella sp.]